MADKTGNVFTRKLIQVKTVEPVTVFYEDNPLRGMSRHAILDSQQLFGEEISIRAEPYYMDKNIFEANTLQEWEINGKKVTNPNTDKQNITLRAGGGTGSFTVEYHIRNLDNLLQGTRDQFRLTF